MKTMEGRYIGGVPDTSAPTDIPSILLKVITGPYIFSNPQWAISRR